MNSFIKNYTPKTQSTRKLDITIPINQESPGLCADNCQFMGCDCDPDDTDDNTSYFCTLFPCELEEVMKGYNIARIRSQICLNVFGCGE